MYIFYSAKIIEIFVFSIIEYTIVNKFSYCISSINKRTIGTVKQKKLFISHYLGMDHV